MAFWGVVWRYTKHSIRIGGSDELAEISNGSMTVLSFFDGRIVPHLF